MNTLKKCYPVFWENGMKLNKDIFLHQHNAITYQNILGLRAHTHSMSYGLFEPIENYEVYLSFDNQQTLHLRIPKLKAITLGGNIIDIDENFDKSLGFEGTVFQYQISNNQDNGDYWVVLFINEFEPISLGFDEEAASNSWAKPSLEMKLLPMSETQFGQMLPNGFVLGEINIRNSQVNVNEEFIPAVIRVNAHPEVYQWYVEVLKILENLDYRTIQIIQKIVQKNQQNDLSKIVYKLCESVSIVLNMHLSKCNILNGNLEPYEFYQVLSSLSRTIKNAIDMNIGSGKEEFMNYISEWVNITPGAFEESLIRISNFKYDIIDNNRNITALNYFITTINQLFETLQKLDFIGKKKDAGLFIKEETTANIEKQFSNNTPEAPKPKRKFFGY